MGLPRGLLIAEFVSVLVFWTVIVLSPSVLHLRFRRSIDELDSPRSLGFLAAVFHLWFRLLGYRQHQALGKRAGIDPETIKRWTINMHSFVLIVAGYVGYVRLDKKSLVAVHFSSNMKWELVNVLQGERLLKENLPRPPDTSLPRYQYKPLSHPRAIRLITIKPVNENSPETYSPIQCQLHEVILDEHPKYVALSYAWESAQGDMPIVCDGALLTVTKNCVAALRRIRASQASGIARVWVDAICINQEKSDVALEEKKRQLDIMGEIYKEAAQVTAWLGEHDASSKLVFNFLQDIAHVYQSSLSKANKTVARKRVMEEGLKTARQWPTFSESLAGFFSRPWFTRMWPIQEVVLPRPGTVKLHCGDSQIELDLIRFGWDVVRELGLLPMSVNLDQSVALQFYLVDAISLKRTGSLPDHWTYGKPLISELSQFSLTSVMKATRFKACKYPKDKFYALLGVFKELGIHHRVHASIYDSPDSEIFRAIMLSCMEADGNLDALQLPQLPEPYLTHDDFLAFRHDPYDSFSTAMFGMTQRVGKAASWLWQSKDPKCGDDASWRTKLPSWVADWTQWTTNDLDPARDIRLLDSYYSFNFMSATKTDDSHPPVAAPNGKRAELAAELPCPLCIASKAENDHSCCPGSHSFSNIKDNQLPIDVRFAGNISRIGSVDSIMVLWQCAQIELNNLGLISYSAPDPALAAFVETTKNCVLKPSFARAFVSIRMAARILDFVHLFGYVLAVSGAKGLAPRAKEGICIWQPSMASCPTDGYAMRAQAGREGAIGYGDLEFIFQLLGAFWICKTKAGEGRRWYQTTGVAVIAAGFLLWEFRVSIAETVFAESYDDLQLWLVAPICVHLFSTSVEILAVLIGDDLAYLLATTLNAINNFFGMAVLCVWGKRIFIPFVVLVVLRAMLRPSWFVAEVWGTERFRPKTSYTPGMHFFATDTGVTGNTSGPVQRGDVLALLGDGKFLILRPSGAAGKEFEIVGNAYVGKKSRAELVSRGHGLRRVLLK